jgi:hypothetical protein
VAGSGAVSGVDDSNYIKNLLLGNAQLSEILNLVAKETFLTNLMPHMIRFVDSKTRQMFTAAGEDKPQQGDVTVHCLLVQVLRSVYSNQFFDFSASLKTTVPILMNLALLSTFHEPTSQSQVLQLKRSNA